MDKFKKKLYKASIYILSGSEFKYLKKDYSVSENISFLYSYYYDYRPSKFKDVKNIIVYKTLFGYREFITDKVVPYLKYKKNSHYKKDYKLTEEQPIFIAGDLNNSLATLDDLKKYLEEELNPEKYQITENYDNNEVLKKYYLEELNNIFKKAWNNYNEQLKEADYSSEKARKKYEKDLDKEKIKELKKLYSEIGGK